MFLAFKRRAEAALTDQTELKRLSKVNDYWRVEPEISGMILNSSKSEIIVPAHSP
jgi:hypothetical protein